MGAKRRSSCFVAALAVLLLTSLTMEAQKRSPMSATIQLESEGLAIAAPASGQEAFQLMGSATCTGATVRIVPGAAQATGAAVGGQQRVVKTGVLTWKSVPKSGSTITGSLKFTLDNGVSYLMELSVPGSDVTGSCKMRSSSATLTLRPSE